ncbi:MAG: PfkB family carbohydrate kinase [Anaerolineae bacterium]
MREDGHVLVVGAAGLDVKASPYDAVLIEGTSNPGRIRNTVGGVARNIAENLARLEVPVVLLSAVGDDPPGQRVLEQAEESGIDITHVLQVPEARTGEWMGLMRPDGSLRLAVDDYEIMEHLTPKYLNARRRLFAGARMVVIDANLRPRTLETLFRLAAKYALPVCADPTSANLASRLCPHLNQLYMITPNVRETAALCGISIRVSERDTAFIAARELVALGVKIAVVTLGSAGLVYAAGPASGYIPALRTEVIDATGAGDALTAGVIFGLLHEVPLDEAMRLGVSAASLTLRTRHTVVPRLTQEMLFDQLV